MTALALPTRAHEEWRYSDLDALAGRWPHASHAHAVAPGETRAMTLLVEGDAAHVGIEDHRFTVGAGGRLEVDAAILGGRLGRIALDVTLAAGAHFQLNGAILAGAGRTHEIVTRVTHAEPDGTSAQVVRAILGGGATGSYLGKLAVARGAQRTDASQSAKAMLLDRTATANLKPELEIFADDVKCAHGAAIGELDAQALFYLSSRGLPPAAAKALLLRAFVGGLFDGRADEAKLTAAIDAALEVML